MRASIALCLTLCTCAPTRHTIHGSDGVGLEFDMRIDATYKAFPEVHGFIIRSSRNEPLLIVTDQGFAMSADQSARVETQLARQRVPGWRHAVGLGRSLLALALRCGDRTLTITTGSLNSGEAEAAVAMIATLDPGETCIAVEPVRSGSALQFNQP